MHPIQTTAGGSRTPSLASKAANHTLVVPGGDEPSTGAPPRASPSRTPWLVGGVVAVVAVVALAAVAGAVVVGAAWDRGGASPVAIEAPAVATSAAVPVEAASAEVSMGTDAANATTQAEAPPSEPDGRGAPKRAASSGTTSNAATSEGAVVDAAPPETTASDGTAAIDAPVAPASPGIATPDAVAPIAPTAVVASPCLTTATYSGRSDGRPFTLVVTAAPDGSLLAKGRVMVGDVLNTLTLSGGCEAGRVTLRESKAGGVEFTGTLAPDGSVAGTVVTNGREAAWSVKAK